jgi:hypothetical protein
MRLHVHRARRVDEVFCVSGLSTPGVIATGRAARRAIMRSVGKLTFNLHRQTRSYLRWHADPLQDSLLWAQRACRSRPCGRDVLDVRQVTEGWICFCLNRPVSRHLGVSMRPARASLATRRIAMCFPLPLLAGPLVGGFLQNLAHHHHHHHHHHGHNHGHCHNNGHNGQGINQRLAQEDFKDAAQNFARGDFAGGMEEISEGLGRLANGPGPVLGHAATARALAAEDRKDAMQDFMRGDFAGGFEELGEANRRCWY